MHGKQLLDESPDSMQMLSAKHSQMFSPTVSSIVGPHSQSGRSIPSPPGSPATPESHLLSVLTYTHPIRCAGQPCPRGEISGSVAIILLTCKSREKPMHQFTPTGECSLSLSKHFYYGSTPVKAQFRIQKSCFMFPPKHLIMTAIQFIKCLQEKVKHKMKPGLC